MQTDVTDYGALCAAARFRLREILSSAAIRDADSHEVQLAESVAAMDNARLIRIARIPFAVDAAIWLAFGIAGLLAAAGRTT